MAVGVLCGLLLALFKRYTPFKKRLYTAMTLRNPSNTSRSCLLSSNFFKCAVGIASLDGLLSALASRAASSVRSRATENINVRTLVALYTVLHPKITMVLTSAE